MALPPLLHHEAIRERLRVIFPEGTPAREHILKPVTARLLFSALYIGAIEGEDRWLAPRHIYRMTDDLAADASEATRLGFYRNVPRSGEASWYADNSREGGRDEGMRQGLLPLNAMMMRTEVATTSREGRYALRRDFVDLLDPSLDDAAFVQAAEAWGKIHLSGAARARAAILRQQEAAHVSVTLPRGGSIMLPYGTSPLITKDVVEKFAPRFLGNPAVAWISDSAVKKYKDDTLERDLQIRLDVAKLLPDVVLVDLDPPGRPGRVLIVFVEVVSSDGAVTEGRKEALLALLAASPMGYAADDAAFVTAYEHRRAPPVARALREIAWGTYAWFRSDPDHLIKLADLDPAERKLSEL